MPVVKKIVTIGGGKIRTKSTLIIDEEIIRLSAKKRPKLLFIPTASSDSEGYWKHIQKYFGRYLGCKTDVLFLMKEHPAQNEIAKKILAADIIYVGGGNTLKMMKLWRKLGVDKLLKNAYQKGKVLCGVSAGSICWFDSGHSDSMSFHHPKKWEYIRVKGLGLIKGCHCPHYDSATKGVKRMKNFQKMIKKNGGFGIALENNCAIEFVGNTYRVLASKKYATAYKVYRKNGKVVSEKIEKQEKFEPLRNLYKKALAGR